MPREVFGFLPAAGRVWLRAAPAPSPRCPSPAPALCSQGHPMSWDPCTGDEDTGSLTWDTGSTRPPLGSPGWALPGCRPKETPGPSFDLPVEEHKKGRAPPSPQSEWPQHWAPRHGMLAACPVWTRPCACTRVRVAPAVPPVLLRLPPRGSGQEEPVDSNEGSRTRRLGMGGSKCAGCGQALPQTPALPAPSTRSTRSARTGTIPARALPVPGSCSPKGPVLPGLSTLRVLRAQPSRAAQDAECLSSCWVDPACD